MSNSPHTYSRNEVNGCVIVMLSTQKLQDLSISMSGQCLQGIKDGAILHYKFLIRIINTMPIDDTVLNLILRMEKVKVVNRSIYTL